MDGHFVPNLTTTAADRRGQRESVVSRADRSPTYDESRIRRTTHSVSFASRGRSFDVIHARGPSRDPGARVIDQIMHSGARPGSPSNPRLPSPRSKVCSTRVSSVLVMSVDARVWRAEVRCPSARQAASNCETARALVRCWEIDGGIYTMRRIAAAAAGRRGACLQSGSGDFVPRTPTMVGLGRIDRLAVGAAGRPSIPRPVDDEMAR